MATDGPEYIVNELLMYLGSKLDSDTSSDVTNAIYEFYCDEAVDDAKMVLWESYSIIATLGRNIARRTKYKQVEDIVVAYQAVDSTYPDRSQMPVIFVARSMTNLPQTKQPTVSVHSKEGCVLENRVTVLETQIAELIKASAMAQSADGLKNKSSDTSPVQQPESVGDGNDEPPDSSKRRPYSAVLDNGQQQSRDREQRDTSAERTDAGDRGWTEVPTRDRRRNAVYGNKQSNALKAPPRRYDFVVFNVTSDHDIESVKSYITSNDVEVLNIKMLPTKKERTDCLMFKVDVHFEDKHKVLNSEFWPENVGCREFYKRSRFEQRVVNQQKHDE